MDRKKSWNKLDAGIRWYIILPLIMEWVITALVKGCAQFIYIQMNSGRLRQFGEGSAEMEQEMARLTC